MVLGPESGKTSMYNFPYFAFETKPNLLPLHLLNNDILSHSNIYSLSYSLTFELSQSGPVVQCHFRASLP